MGAQPAARRIAGAGRRKSSCRDGGRSRRLIWLLPSSPSGCRRTRSTGWPKTFNLTSFLRRNFPGARFSNAGKFRATGAGAKASEDGGETAPGSLRAMSVHLLPPLFFWSASGTSVFCGYPRIYKCKCSPMMKSPRPQSFYRRRFRATYFPRTN